MSVIASHVLCDSAALPLADSDSTQQIALLRLPGDVLRLILARLDLSDRAALARTCKQLRNNGLHPDLWTEDVRHPPLPPGTTARQRVIMTYAPRVASTL